MISLPFYAENFFAGGLNFLFLSGFSASECIGQLIVFSRKFSTCGKDMALCKVSKGAMLGFPTKMARNMNWNS